jgi:hypothetical protein
MTERRLGNGQVAYYWHPNRRDVAAGFHLACEGLGTSYAAAVERAHHLNHKLDDWRAGRDEGLEEGPPLFGSLAWMFAAFQQTRRFKGLAERTKPGYRAAMERLTEIKTKEGERCGDYLLKTVTPLAADMLYDRLRIGKKGQEIFRQANLSIWLAGLAWRMVQRRYPDVFPEINPFEGIERESRKTAKPAATRKEAYALSDALRQMGHPHLGLVPLVCYEWHQRPEAVLAGHLRWSDVRPASHPNAVRVEHHKTKQEVWLPLEDRGRKAFAEIEAYLATLPRLGTPIVLTPGNCGACRPYSEVYAAHLVQKARGVFGLPAHVTLDTCRHGGMTELGDAELTEQEIMSVSGHLTPESARLYVKRTERQRLTAVSKRRRWVKKSA